MSQYPDVFKKGLPGTRGLRSHPDPPRSAVRLRPSRSIAESKEVQTSSTALIPSNAESKEAETSTELLSFREAPRPARPKTVIKIPAPIPATQNESLAVDLVGDGKLYVKMHSARSWKQSLIAQSIMLRNSKPSVSFDNEEIKGKLLPADSYWRQTSKSRSESRTKSRTSARPVKTVPGREGPVVVEGKPLTVRTPHRSRKSLSCANPTRPPPDPPIPPVQFGNYSLGQASVPPQFALPSVYSQAFGQVLSEAERRHETLQVISTLFHVPHSSTSAYRVTHTQSDFYVMTIGTLVPISKCCKSALVVQLCAELGGKVMCTAWHCNARTLFTFQISEVDKERLWGETENSSKAVSMQIQTGGHRSRSLRNGVLRKSVVHPPERPHSPHKDSFSPDKAQVRRQDPLLLGLRDCITLKLQEQPQRSFQSSPIRRVLAKGYKGAMLGSLDELKKAWEDVEVSLC